MIVSASGTPTVRQLALGGERNRPMKLDLVDHGVFLSATQRVRQAPERRGGLHVEAYEYLVSSSEVSRDWVVRWECEENPRPGYPYPRAHLHFNGRPANEHFFGADLGSAHFATRKMLLEDVLLCICTDVVIPRLVGKNKDERDARLAVLRIEEELARLSGRDL